MGIFTLALTSCSSYNEKTCEDLIDKYDDKGKLNDKDLAEAIKQCDAMLDNINSQLEKIQTKASNKDDDAIDLFEEFDESTMLEQFNRLYSILQYSDLKGENKKSFKELEKKSDKVERVYKKARKKVRKLED